MRGPLCGHTVREVSTMNDYSAMQETLYDSVQSLLAADPRAKAYFLTLSEAQQGWIQQHSDRVCSYERLRQYGENAAHHSFE